MKLVDQNNIIVLIKGEDLTHNIHSYSFKDDNILVKFKNTDNIYSYQRKNVTIIESCLNKTKSRATFKYLKKVASLISLVSESGHNLLESHYDKINFIRKDTILSPYLEGKLKYNTDSIIKHPIFPFNFNISQKEATQNALINKLSIIEGPPGTGKTQTILNIIANVVMEGKSVAVVSNNNSAIANILNKLQGYGIDFIIAHLGKLENKETFINNQTSELPNMESWKLETAEEKELQSILKVKAFELSEMLETQNRLSKLKNNLEEIALEYNYHKKYAKDEAPQKKFRFFSKMSSKEALSLWLFSEKYAKKHLWGITKFLNIFRYKIFNFSFYDLSPTQQIILSQSHYYTSKIKELKALIENLEKQYSSYSIEQEMKEFSQLSLKLFQSFLSKKYSQGKRPLFEHDDLWKNSKLFAKQYPLVLSTTHSLRTSLNHKFVYDYVIIDEASQVDLATGSLALSCAKRAVIVGDTKQLTHIVSSEDRAKIDYIFQNEFKLNHSYHFSKSIIESVSSLFPQVPITLLKEHYRCHPKIINFCNKKFYNDQLVILTNPKSSTTPMAVYKTPVGNHARGNFNQREIDVILHEVFPNQKIDSENENIGIVTPYNHQRNALQEIFNGTPVMADTVDKFQGQEKDTIIISTVDNSITAFADDPKRMNVAVSRAKNRLILVTNGNPKDNTNVQDLIDYIEYNNFEVIESSVRSVFDYLYSAYNHQRVTLLKESRKISQYDSENLAYALITKILQKEQFIKLDVANHISLGTIIKGYNKLTKKEFKYASNPLTHVDFLIFQKLNKKPILAIEVDGTSFHKKGTRQAKRDKMKNEIMAKYSIPLLRLSTNESQEEQRIINSLSKILSRSATT